MGKEIRRCVDFATSLKGKALIWTLFETGARAEEFLNIRLKDIEEKKSYFLVRIDYPKTFKRRLPVYEGADYLRQWREKHPAKDQPNAQLFTMTYGALLKFLHRLGERVLGKKINPQLFRDSFATWLASKKVGRYQMCKLMGWAMSSDMPDRYIDRTGVVEEEAIQGIRGDELGKVSRENSELRTALKRLEAQSNEMRERLEKQEQIDRFLNLLLKDEKLGKVLLERIRAKGLADGLSRL